MPRRRWADLPPDLVREISGRLYVAADFVSFHAVCKPWHDSHSRHLTETTTNTTNQFFLPWLLDPAEIPYFPLKLRCIFSKSSYRGPRPPRYELQRSWVASADGTARWYLNIQVHLPSLHDPLTGAVTHLPPFPFYLNGHLEKNPCGILYDDGTILLYTISFRYGSGMATFRAAVLCPGELRWTFVSRNLRTTRKQGQFCATYHGGRIVVTADAGHWRVVTLDNIDDDLVPRLCTPGEQEKCMEDCSYVLESRGELLWASVQVRWSYNYHYGIGSRRVRSLSVLVHALEIEACAPEKARWVRKDCRCLADRVLFLGSPNSFAVDASRLDDERGCAYFVYYNSNVRMRPLEQFGVFCYNFLDGKTKFVERIRPRIWDEDKCMWLIPQPTIAPVQEINESKQAEPSKLKELETVTMSHPTDIIQMERHYEHSFTVLVRNLPLNVKGYQLHRFFSKHGKVSDAEIIYYKKTKTSQGIGLVTMATMHVHKDDALAALDGLVLDGCRLDVILVNDGQRRQRRAELAREQLRYMQLYPGRG